MRSGVVHNKLARR